MTGIIQAITLFLKIFQTSGGPEKLNSWFLGKLPELEQIHANLSGPDQP